jgi:hypothetical protein
MFIRHKIIGKYKYYIIEDRKKVDGKYLTTNIRYLGSAQKLLKDLQELDQLRSKKA